MNENRMPHSENSEPSDEFLDAEVIALYRTECAAYEPQWGVPALQHLRWGRSATIRARRIGQAGRFALGRSL